MIKYLLLCLICILTLLVVVDAKDSFVPDSAVGGIYNFLDNDKQVFSGGFNMKLPKFNNFPGQLDFIGSFQYQKLSKRYVYKPEISDNQDNLNPSYSYGGECLTVFGGINYYL